MCTRDFALHVSDEQVLVQRMDVGDLLKVSLLTVGRCRSLALLLAAHRISGTVHFPDRMPIFARAKYDVDGAHVLFFKL